MLVYIGDIKLWKLLTYHTLTDRLYVTRNEPTNQMVTPTSSPSKFRSLGYNRIMLQ